MTDLVCFQTSLLILDLTFISCSTATTHHTLTWRDLVSRRTYRWHWPCDIMPKAHSCTSVDTFRGCALGRTVQPLLTSFISHQKLAKPLGFSLHKAIGGLTGDIEEGISWRRRAKSVGWLTTIPAGVAALDTTDDEATVSVDAGSRHQPGHEVNVDAVTEPLVGDVVGMSLGLTHEPHPRPFQCRRVLWRYHDVCVCCKVVDNTGTFTNHSRVLHVCLKCCNP